MPAKSKAQQALMAIAEHNPNSLHGENRNVLKMSHKQLHDFASTSKKNLPNKVSSKAAKKVKHE